MTEHVLVQLRLPDGPETLEAAAGRLGVKPDRLDAQYGVVPTDAADRLFCVMLDAKLSEKVTKHLSSAAGGKPDPAEGVFANVGIAPFGEPQLG
jgi:hypothetical protein